MALPFNTTPSKLKRMSIVAVREMVLDYATRLQIPVKEVGEYDPQWDEGEITLGGDYEHIRVLYGKGKYTVCGYSPYFDEAFFSAGDGWLDRDVKHMWQRCRGVAS